MMTELHCVWAGQEVMLRDDRESVMLIIREDADRSNWRPFPDSFGNAHNIIHDVTERLRMEMMRMDETIHPKD